MGMVNYLAKFISNLSNVTVPLRELLKKDTAWHWEDIHQKAFEEIKSRVTAEKLLQYYDVSKPVVLSVDSSSYGLGACLLQEERPVSYASRSLNSAEKNYAQIEKELLAILFGCTKYHQYIYSKPVTVRVPIQKAANSCTAETTTNDAEFTEVRPHRSVQTRKKFVYR